MQSRSFRFAPGAAVALGVASGAALAAGDLSRQTPTEVTIDLGGPGKHAFVPNQLKLETGKLYKLTTRTTSPRTRSRRWCSRARRRWCSSATART